MLSAKNLILAASALACVNATIVRYSMDQGAVCDSHTYTRSMILEVYSRYCKYEGNRWKLGEYNFMERYMAEDQTKLVYLPLPMIGSDGNLDYGQSTDRFVVVDSDCSYYHVTRVRQMGRGGENEVGSLIYICYPPMI
ncbi:BgTH12-03151 [Blumeria graminis f. sp. triticale]|uniref:Bgt-50261 n=2 Tax=Blumeria graminis TaxID=34373 RepID=A0A9X9MJC8_BLUGR|nr:BgTH12-03151 [Blumeria graminis f. sp. triticale]VDB89585.1 Bgt-50261 [Blumeria graminis f. sp. tritici]